MIDCTICDFTADYNTPIADSNYKRIAELEIMLKHTMKHLANVVKEMKPRVEDCPDHPGAPKWATGAPGFGYRYTCGWTTPDAHCARSLAVINY